MLRRSVTFALLSASLLCAYACADTAVAGTRHAAMILDANTGAVLHEDDGDELRHPASLTKMMTLYLTFETLESGRLRMGDRITISKEAASAAPSKLDLDPGDEIAVADAIKALVTKSANDVAVALSEKIGGTQANFVRLMNTRARELGMSKTHFENASGLPHDDQVTTARDMITLALHLQDDYPSYYPMFALRAFTYNGSTHRNHNTMLNSFAGIDGIKTGYTSKSGFNLVTSVHRNGRHLIGAVFGGASAATRNGEMRILLTRALTRASAIKTRKPMPSLIAKLKSGPQVAERPARKEKPPMQVALAVDSAAQIAVAQPKPFAPAKPIWREPAIAAQTVSKSDAAALEVMAQTASLPEPTPLQVFKVKRVFVAPRQGPPAPAPSADETTDMAPEGTTADGDGAESAMTVEPPPVAQPASLTMTNQEAASTMPRLASGDLIAQSLAADDVAAERETIVPKMTAAAGRPSALDNHIAMLGASDVAPPAPASEAAEQDISPKLIPAVQNATASMTALPLFAKAAAKTLAKPVQPLQRGQAPSSLQAQAATIAPNSSKIASLQPATTARYEIQIGAYGSIDEAQRALASTQSRVGKLLSGYASVTHPVQKDGRQVFRARFSGFDATRASSTCTELRRQAVDCFVMTAE